MEWKTRKRRLSFSVEIFERYKNPEKQKLNTYALVDDSLFTKHELNEQMFLDFIYLIEQDQTDNKAVDEFLEEKSLKLKKMRAEAEAAEVFKNYERSVSFGNGPKKAFINSKK